MLHAWPTFACESFSNSHRGCSQVQFYSAFVPDALPTFSPHFPTAQLSESSILLLKLSLKALGEQALAATLVCSSAPFVIPSPAPPTQGPSTSGQLSLCLSQWLSADRGSPHSKLQQALEEVTLPEVSLALGISPDLNILV